MLWPILLPFKITACIFAVAMMVVITTSPAGLKKLVARCFLASLIAAVAFVPSCMGVMVIVDSQRFGEFHYPDRTELHDIRIWPGIPPNARDITVHKNGAGHRAMYNISRVDLLAHLDMHWQSNGEYSAIPRDQLHDGKRVDVNSINQEFRDLGWPPLRDIVEYHSPVGHDGSGTKYYFDQSTETAYHRTSYW